MTPVMFAEEEPEPDLLFLSEYRLSLTDSVTVWGGAHTAEGTR